jgi:mitochondrial import receptor subunit TOM40
MTGLLVTHYLQSVTPSIALGAELVYQYGPTVPGGEIALLSAAARYTGRIDNMFNLYGLVIQSLILKFL